MLYKHLEMPLPFLLTIPSGVSIGEWIFYQFALVGVFEELFFRGYIQTQFERVSRVSLAGEVAAFWLPIVCSAFLFAVAHLVVNWIRAHLGCFSLGSCLAGCGRRRALSSRRYFPTAAQMCSVCC